MPDEIIQLDLTMETFQVPALPDYGNPIIGTKKESGGLSTLEVNDNIMMPWIRARPLLVAGPAAAKQGKNGRANVQADAVLKITASRSINIDIGIGDYDGVTVTVINPTQFSHVINEGIGRENIAVPSESKVVLTWLTDKWVKSSSSSGNGTVLIFETMAQYEAAVAETDMNAVGYIPNGSLVIIKNSPEEYLHMEEQEQEEE